MTTLRSDNRSFVARIVVSIVATVAVLLVMWAQAGNASAADTRTEVRKLPDGSTEVCKYESAFETTLDGSHVYRTAWRCVKTGSGKAAR